MAKSFLLPTTQTHLSPLVETLSLSTPGVLNKQLRTDDLSAIVTLSASARSSLPYSEKSLFNVFHWPLNKRPSLRDRIRLKILGILRHYTSDTGPHLLPDAFIINIIDVKANRVAKTPPPTAAPHLTSQIGKIHQAATALPKTNSPKTSLPPLSSRGLPMLELRYQPAGLSQGSPPVQHR